MSNNISGVTTSHPDFLRTDASEDPEGVSETSWRLDLPSFDKSDDWSSASILHQIPSALQLDHKTDPIDDDFTPEDDSCYTNEPTSTFRVPILSFSDTNSRRKLHLSKSPLDHLQAEFKRYVDAEIHRDAESSAKQAGQNDGVEARSNALDWSYVKRRIELPFEQVASYDCPSMTTGSTLSSRNSSTRSTKSNKFDARNEQSEKGMCPIPECGRMFRDLDAHLLTHQAERPEKCPMEVCEYHTKGFARPYDKVRHTLTHFNGTFLCGFCTVSDTTSENSFSRCDAFLRHLVIAHGAEQVSPGRRDEQLYRLKTGKDNRKSFSAQLVATCSLCTEPFDVQGYYEHLRGCVLRQVTRSCAVPDTVYETNSPVGTGKFSHGHHENDITGVKNDVCPSMPSSDFGSCVSRANSLTGAPSLVNSSPIDHHRRSQSQDYKMDELTASSRCLSLTSSHGDAGGRSSSDEETDWTDDVGSPDSAPDTEGLKPILSPVKVQLVNSIMAQFHLMFDEALRSHHTGDAGGDASSRTSGYKGSSGSSSYSASSFISRKRSLSGGSTPPDKEGDDPHKRRRPDPNNTIGGKNAIPEVRFACPYYKRNPGRHQTFTSCRDPGFITVARLKEHLYRRHLLPIQCNRCCSTFPNEPTLREHQRDARGCEVKEHIPLEGFDKNQERKLKSKKRSLVYQSEEDKWKGVYTILFPDDNEADVPSPYIEYQLCNLASGQNDSSSTTNLAQFHEFSRLELPRLVRHTLEVAVEQEAQPLEEKLKDRLVDIVRDCQSQLIALFRTTQMRTVEESELTPALLVPHEKNEAKDLHQQHQQQQQQRHSEIEAAHPAPSFQDFDSFALAVTASNFIPIPATRDDIASVGPHQHKRPSNELSSGSPDSGYDSALTWSNPTIMPHHHPHPHPHHQQQTHHLHQQQQAPPSSYILHHHATTTAAAAAAAAAYTSTSMPMYAAPSAVGAGFQQPVTASGSGFAEGDFADLDAYRGLLDGSCDMRFVADPASWAYVEPVAENGNVGNGHIMG